MMAELILALHLLAQHGAPTQCEVGHATLHNAWAGVFAHFPERIDPTVDGYIATADCSEIGEYRIMAFGGRLWRVRVADCLNRHDAPSPGWVADIDYRIWWQAYPHRALMPQPVAVCKNVEVAGHVPMAMVLDR